VLARKSSYVLRLEKLGYQLASVALTSHAWALWRNAVWIHPVEWAIDVRIDPDWDSVDALEHPEDFRLPILLFHGTDDDVVPIRTSDDFAAELPGWVEYHRVPDAGHTESWNVDPRLYEARLARFLESALGSGKPTPETGRARPRGSGSTR